MKKSAIALVLVLAVAGGLLYFLSKPGGVSVGGVDLGGAEKAYLRERTIDFLEDIRFKDFDKGSTYHLAATQEKRDIPKLLRRVFKVKHEMLDITNYRITEVELDRSKKRGRVRAMIDYHIIGDVKVREHKDSTRDVEMLFYWFKQEDGTWVMELESSLRGG